MSPIGHLVAAVRVSREFAEQPELPFKLNTLVVNLRLVVNNVTHLCANGHDQAVERYVNPQTRAQACRACDKERQRRKREERAARKAWQPVGHGTRPMSKPPSICLRWG